MTEAVTLPEDELGVLFGVAVVPFDAFRDVPCGATRAVTLPEDDACFCCADTICCYRITEKACKNTMVIIPKPIIFSALLLIILCMDVDRTAIKINLSIFVVAGI